MEYRFVKVLSLWYEEGLASSCCCISDSTRSAGVFGVSVLIQIDGIELVGGPGSKSSNLSLDTSYKNGEDAKLTHRCDTPGVRNQADIINTPPERRCARNDGDTIVEIIAGWHYVEVVHSAPRSRNKCPVLRYMPHKLDVV